MLLKLAFPGENGYQQALAEAIDGMHGGLRLVLDKMTKTLKEEARKKHLLKTFKTNIDPLDFSIKEELIAELMNRIRPYLPEAIATQPASRYADNYEELLEAFVHSQEALTAIFRRL